MPSAISIGVSNLRRCHKNDPKQAGQAEPTISTVSREKKGQVYPSRLGLECELHSNHRLGICTLLLYVPNLTAELVPAVGLSLSVDTLNIVSPIGSLIIHRRYSLMLSIFFSMKSR
jgi:hypothetical protein